MTPSSHLRCHERLELGDVSPAGGRNFSTELQGYLCRGDRRHEHTLNLLCLECEQPLLVVTIDSPGGPHQCGREQRANYRYGNNTSPDRRGVWSNPTDLFTSHLDRRGHDLFTHLLAPTAVLDSPTSCGAPLLGETVVS